MFKQIFKDIFKGDNLTVLATILLVVITLIAKGLGLVSESMVDSMILAMLGLIGVGFLILRYRILEVIKTSQVLEAANLIQLLDDFPVLLESYLKNANEIWMLGITLRKTTHNHYEDFCVRVKNGLKIRALLLNPYSRFVNLSSVAQSYSRKDSPELFAAEYRPILMRFDALRNEANHTSEVQVGLLDFVPPFSLYIFPHDKQGGVIFVQLYAYKAPVGTTPYFIITQKQNPIWYENFCRLYEQMCEDSVDYFGDCFATPVQNESSNN